MRIRSIHPKFWRSDDVDALDFHTRLLFIGLWSYVDDNGVGRDRLSDIAADLFAGDLSRDPRDTFARVAAGLLQLEAGGQIVRYSVDGVALIYVATWGEYQRVDRPGKSRYPLPTCDDTDPTPSLATPSRDVRDSLDAGEGEKGRRGEGEKGVKTCSPSGERASTTTPASLAFEAFWDAYPRKVGKDAARRAWAKAARTVGADQLLEAARRLAADPNLPETQFVPHPSTWLNRGGWADEPYPGHVPKSNGRVAQGLALVQHFQNQARGELT